jgi:hypothetical protein
MVLDNVVSLDGILSVSSSIEERHKLIEKGAELFSQHIESILPKKY